MATVPSSRDPDERLAGSQFLITLGDNIGYLDGKAAVFGKVVEGFDTLEKINDAFTDSNGRPLKDIRIRHTVILEDPFEDPPGLVIPDKSPLPTKAQLATVMIADDEELDNNIDEAAMEKLRRERGAGPSFNFRNGGGFAFRRGQTTRERSICVQTEPSNPRYDAKRGNDMKALLTPDR